MKQTDVLILGGGFAGLTLARQLRLSCREHSITVLEHRRFPAPDAAFKVGESTVEIAAHYLADHLGLRDHLESEQLPKFGLRLFCRGDQPIEDDLSRYDEIGVSRVLPVRTYQLDRGRFETALADICRAQGVHILDGATVRGIDLQSRAHRVRVRHNESETTIRARYLIDATGRRAMLREQLQFTRDARHNNDAVWFRVEGDIDVDAMSREASFLDRCCGTPRRLSTNHFVGPGYWIWLIPLVSQSTSVGVVFDPRWVDENALSSHEKLIEWVAQEHPLVARQLADKPPMDFHRLRRYAVASTSVFSSDGWALSGDAGLFSDPFYSPGGDFIALANTMITELVRNDMSADACADFQRYYFAFFASTLSLYKGLYGGFGNRDFMLAKTVWDYSYYWGVLAKLFFSRRLTDRSYMAQSDESLKRAFAMNSSLQRQMRQVARRGERIGGDGRFFDHHNIGFFHEWKNDLLVGTSTEDGARLQQNIESLEGVLGVVREMLEHGADTSLGAFDQAVGFA